ncbi:hypothetical protein [Nocardia takedensis]|uniref:hypothetical protein n=2 Tax=Nocardia takedensis TaxID=259390 RepID=UPI0012F6219F|nr:hypothetical protein [Nocardia takedensis]
MPDTSFTLVHNVCRSIRHSVRVSFGQRANLPRTSVGDIGKSMVRGREWTGFEAAALQEAMRRSIRDFAATLGIDTTTVANWRSGLGTVTPRPRMQEILDTTLEQRATAEDRARFEQILAEGEAVWRERHVRRAASAELVLESPQQPYTTTSVPHPSATTVQESARDAAWEDPVERKTFLQVMTGSVVGLALGAGTTARSSDSVDALKSSCSRPELVDYFRAQLAGHYTADAYLGSIHLIPTVRAQTELIIRLASETDDPTRHDLLETGAAYAALLGWLYQDSGDLSASTEWRCTTLALAHRSGDRQILSYALSNMAMLALDQDDGRVVVEYARAARTPERELSPKCRVIALQHEAQGHAMLGDRATADRLLDDAAHLVDKVDDHHPWGNASRRTPHHIQVQRAICYGRTGTAHDAAAAVVLWDEIIDTLPELARRDNAVFRARQSAALAKVPDPDRAVWAAAEAVEVLGRTGSARLRRELKALPTHSHQWANTSAGRELRAIVGSVA